MTRGRHTNTARLYERIADAHEQPTGPLSLIRGNSIEAAQFVRSLIARDSIPRTAHQVASLEDSATLSSRVASLMNRRADAVESRRDSFRAWQTAVTQQAQDRADRERGVTLSREGGYSLDM